MNRKEETTIMAFLGSYIRNFAKEARNLFQSVLLAFPNNVQCNICKWEGRRFLSDSWHKYIHCPWCRSGVRQRLLIAALQECEEFSFDNIISGKSILHFAPEIIVSSIIRKTCRHYVTADFFREDCDMKLDMTNMPEIGDGRFDVVIAFDVLEHVPNYQNALTEVHRVLTSRGLAIFTVPQQDDLEETYEDSKIVSSEDRIKHFGQSDHLRIFGNDFPDIVERRGFSVTPVCESTFSKEIADKHVLYPPIQSKHPLATNHRKVFFCRKTS